LKISQPHVDPSRCTGCGICENKCPLTDRPGIRIFGTNESRSDYQAVSRETEELPPNQTGGEANPYGG
jgi:ferredoxin